jgi:endonuclease G
MSSKDAMRRHALVLWLPLLLVGPQLAAQDSARADSSLPAALRGNDNLRWGYPGGRGTVLVKQHFVILYDGRYKVPTWVTYHLTRDELQGTESRTNNFRPDTALPPDQRSELVDYRRSGYDRGHMAPAADFKRDQAAMSETFLLSNMAPQRPHLNRQIWAHLEDQVRALIQAQGSMWIFTGALYLDSLQSPTVPTSYIGPDSVAVPTHFYKVILCEHPDGSHEMFAFVLPNALAPQGEPRDYIVSVDRVQHLSGLDFFAALPDSEEHRLEAVVNTNWPIP